MIVIHNITHMHLLMTFITYGKYETTKAPTWGVGFEPRNIKLGSQRAHHHTTTCAHPVRICLSLRVNKNIGTFLVVSRFLFVSDGGMLYYYLLS